MASKAGTAEAATVISRCGILRSTIIARQKGGDHIENLQLLCGHCNRVKGDRGMEYLIVKLQLPRAA